MQLGMIGLGRMGANLARRRLRGGPPCVVHDRSPATVNALEAEGGTAAAAASLRGAA
jgi:6-phosphogluconate dehydrogenase